MASADQHQAWSSPERSTSSSKEHQSMLERYSGVIGGDYDIQVQIAW
jgi:hypothetical protein